MTAFAGIKNKLEYDQLEMARFIKRHGLTRFKFNPHFPVNTLLTMRGAIVAEMDGELMPYVESLFHHMWEDPKKLDDPAVFMAVLVASGFDGERYQSRIQDRNVKDKLMANTSAAVERGAFGIPTFFVGNEMWFGKDRLRDLEEYLVGRA